MYLSQGGQKQLLYGAAGRLYFDNTDWLRSWQLGFWARTTNQVDGGLNTNTVSLSTQFDLERFQFGFSYDIINQGFGTIDINGSAIEFSVSYLFANKGSFQKFSLPSNEL